MLFCKLYFFTLSNGRGDTPVVKQVFIDPGEDSYDIIVAWRRKIWMQDHIAVNENDIVKVIKPMYNKSFPVAAEEWLTAQPLKCRIVTTCKTIILEVQTNERC